nr:isoform 2 of origin recognition complex subunit 3 [Quercus suber]
MEHEKSYVFQPQNDTRPAKRRRPELRGLQTSWPTALHELHSATISSIATFLNELFHAPRNDRIPTAIVLGGPDATSHVALTNQLTSTGALNGQRLYASLSSTSGTNLKAVLKSIIQKTTTRGVGMDDNEDEGPSTTNSKGLRLLSYDLQILADYVQAHETKQVVITFEDTEAFDSNLLSELIELMGCWLDRIPFVCIFSIATSLDFLQQRLSRGAVRCLEGRLFDAAPSAEETQRVFTAVVSSQTPLRIGTNLASSMLERQNDYIQSIDGFVDALRYTYMSHYYANALSIFLIPAMSYESIPSDHFEALRSLESFRALVRRRLDEGEVKLVRDLLNSDSTLFAMAKEQIQVGQESLAKMVTAIDVIRIIQQHLANVQVSKKSSLYTQAMSGKLEGSAMVRSLLLAVRKAPSNTIIAVLGAMTKLAPKSLSPDHPEFSTILTQLETLLQNQPSDTTTPLRSSDDLQNSTLRPTLVSQKIDRHQQKAALSKQDTAYTTLLRAFTDALEAFFATTLIHPKTLAFHEVFLYDSKTPHREVFTPRPRHAVERALATPHDYLDCECCAPTAGSGGEADEEATLSASQPPSAVLYQLYLESGSLINVHDLWMAFHTVMGDRFDEEEATLAVFERALAELRFLGMVKNTRKRVDHVAKVAWKGL